MSRDPAESDYQWTSDDPVEWLGEERYPWLEEPEGAGRWGLVMSDPPLPRDWARRWKKD